MSNARNAPITTESPKGDISSPGSLTDGPTLDSSGISTPGLFPEKAALPKSEKRKAASQLTPIRYSKKRAAGSTHCIILTP